MWLKSSRITTRSSFCIKITVISQKKRGCFASSFLLVVIARISHGAKYFGGRGFARETIEYYFILLLLYLLIQKFIDFYY